MLPLVLPLPLVGSNPAPAQPRLPAAALWDAAAHTAAGRAECVADQLGTLALGGSSGAEDELGAWKATRHKQRLAGTGAE